MTETSEPKVWESFHEVVAAIVARPLQAVQADVSKRLDDISQRILDFQRESRDTQEKILKEVRALATLARQQNELSEQRDAASADRAELIRSELLTALNTLGEQVARADEQTGQQAILAAALTREVRGLQKKVEDSAASAAAKIQELDGAVELSRQSTKEMIEALTHQVGQLGEQTKEMTSGVVMPLSSRLRRQETTLRAVGICLLLLIAATIVLAVRLG